MVDGRTGKPVYTPPPPDDVPPMMRELVAWLNEPGGIHPVLAAGAAQFQLVHVHPFVDGNGRASRLLSTLCLYRAGYDFKRLFTISEYYDRDRPAFYAAIQSARDQGMDMTGWLEYFAEGLSVQLAEGLLSPIAATELFCKALLRETESDAEESDDALPARFDPRLRGKVSPKLFGRGKVVGDIVGPFFEEWGENP